MDETNPNLKHGKCSNCGVLSSSLIPVDGAFVCEKCIFNNEIFKKIEVSEEFLLNMESDSDVPQRELTPEEEIELDKAFMSAPADSLK